MKKLLILTFLICSISFVNTQDNNQENYSEKVQSLDSTVKALYSIISGGKNLEKNWELFKFLFKEDAEIILTLKNKEVGDTKYYLTVDEYINSYGKWLVKNGFYAKETERAISTFRHMNHVSSTYEYNNSTNDQKLKAVNSINLLKENNRWYISNIKWNQDIDDLKSLKEYFPVLKD